MPSKHEIELKNFDPLMKAFEQQPKNYEELLLVKGIGPKSVRALALISNLIFGTEISWRDPVKYAFCVGGKDGYPEPIDLDRYLKCIEILKDSIHQAKMGSLEKLDALKRLSEFAKIR
jgi:hypothetical protein